MNRRTILAAAFGALTLAATSTMAFAAPAWQYLGSRHVNWLVDHDTINIGLVNGTFDKILVTVRGNGMFLYDLKVTYGNGASQHVPMRFFFAQGSHSRTIALPGVNNRIIRNVQLTYGKPINGNGATYVDLFGRH
jgi:hypothetical protein